MSANESPDTPRTEGHAKRDEKVDPAAEFEDIGFFTPRRALMSKPGPVEATKKFIREVQDELNLTDEQAPAAADWILNKMERYAALSAQPVFDMDGNGPQCSRCGTIWPLCGHHNMSAFSAEDHESKDTP